MPIATVKKLANVVFNLRMRTYFCAVPFDEDDRDPNVWFLDHNYLENMAAMFKKVNCKYFYISVHKNVIESLSLFLSLSLSLPLQLVSI